jgi:hypothetical protein
VRGGGASVAALLERWRAMRRLISIDICEKIFHRLCQSEQHTAFQSDIGESYVRLASLSRGKSPATKEDAMSLGLIVLIILAVVLLGGGGGYYYGGGYPHAFGGGLGFVVVVLLALWVFGAFRVVG